MFFRSQTRYLFKEIKLIDLWLYQPKIRLRKVNQEIAQFITEKCSDLLLGVIRFYNRGDLARLQPAIIVYPVLRAPQHLRERQYTSCNSEREKEREKEDKNAPCAANYGAAESGRRSLLRMILGVLHTISLLVSSLLVSDKFA